MRADQALMIGVVGLGIYALYRLRRSDAGTTDDQQKPPPDGRPVPILTRSPGAGQVPRTPEGFPMAALLTDPTSLPLQNSRLYRGRLELQQDLTTDQVADMLTALGFDNAQVYATPQEADPVLFQPMLGMTRTYPRFALEGAGPRTRWFRGRWTKTDQAVTRPAEMVLVWDDSRIQAQHVIDRIGRQAVYAPWSAHPAYAR